MEISGHNIAMLFFAIINAVAVIVYGWDNLCAIRLFHHKTLHLKFKYGVPLILALQIVGLIYLHLPK